MVYSPEPPPAVAAPPGRRLKHALDRLVAAAGLLVTAPILAPVALALRLSGGPVLVGDERIGENGRTMVVRSLAIGDSRVLAGSGVGALPQLWSVLRGEMSLVGPRPRDAGLEPPPARPGLTGLAQLAQLERPLSVAEQLALDDEYARTWSLGLDARILWRTLSSRGGPPSRPR